MFRERGVGGGGNFQRSENAGSFSNAIELGEAVNV